MSIVFKINKVTDDYKGITFGGSEYTQKGWPKNPNGESLELLCSIDSNMVNQNLSEDLFPHDTYIYVYSTYNEGYFLDDITYFGDAEELEYLKQGYTKVVVTKEAHTIGNEAKSVNVDIDKFEIDDDSFPAFSFLSKHLPKGLSGIEGLLNDYYFVGQFYSSDIPIKNGGVLGLSDANGYLFLRKEFEEGEDSGLFFVQTA
ncbi:hypothetical protein [Vibrio quintilis]|uniref:DUF1963 domain-containing protein n=1 Tax=Vibrio quintilis TaxID=1117707 RepID=A0A1M7YQ49_9VIBR|nr:hypothetical protein [Vibrio quintilis]SHO54705.1 hypothetical protein VQ7734_00421 [Vibrio quintilis]